MFWSTLVCINWHDLLIRSICSGFWWTWRQKCCSICPWQSSSGHRRRCRFPTWARKSSHEVIRANRHWNILSSVHSFFWNNSTHSNDIWKVQIFSVSITFSLFRKFHFLEDCRFAKQSSYSSFLWYHNFPTANFDYPFRCPLLANDGKYCRSLLVANAGDCRAVLSRLGMAIEMSKDHRPCCLKERKRIESLGGYVDDGYLNGQLGVTRALGDWHLEGMKTIGEPGGPLSAEPELKLITLNKDDEFLIIGSDGLWDVFSNQNAVDFARRKLQEHNDAKLCCKQLVEEAIRRGADDNLTAVMICFHLDPPPPIIVQKSKVRRSISAEGLQNVKGHLEGLHCFNWSHCFGIEVFFRLWTVCLFYWGGSNCIVDVVSPTDRIGEFGAVENE